MTSASTISAPTTAAAAFLQTGGACGTLLREIDWTGHPLGPPEQWPVMLQTTVSIILGSRQPMLICWGPDHHTIYNDGYAVLCGNRHPMAMATPFSLIWPDNWDVAGPIIARVYAGESLHMDDLELPMHRHGFAEIVHFSFSCNPLRDSHGQVLGMFSTCGDVTEQVMLRRELQHERAQLGEIFKQSPSFIVKLKGQDHIFEIANPAYMRIIGHRDVIGKPISLVLPKMAGQGFTDILDSVLATGKTIRTSGAKVTLQCAAGNPPEDRVIDFVYQPVKNVSGTITGVIAIGADVTDRTNALAALKESEQFLRSVISASPDCIKVLDLEGRISFMSDGGRLIMEVPEDEVVDGRFLPDFWHEPNRAEVLVSLQKARQGETARFQSYGDTFAGNRRYWDVRVKPMLDALDQPNRILAVSRDITYLKRIEEERELLMNELSHRLKNAFAMVQSVINQTLRQSVSVQDAREVLSGRVRALANAQDILTQSLASEMQMDDVVNAALLPHRTGEGRFIISGPVAAINGKQGLGLSLALHELATNARKYGALSGHVGKVAIGWGIQPNGIFTFQWQESGGPLVTVPTRNGFGSVLIEKIVATYFDGTATLDFHPAGVMFHLVGTIAPPDAADVTAPY